MTSQGPQVRRGLLDLTRPVFSLTIAFCAWKAILLLTILSCPGTGYDTSTSLLTFQPTHASPLSLTIQPGKPRFRAWQLMRWDSIYFVHIAEHGYVFEQEWAFGYGYTKILRFLTGVFSRTRDVESIALVGTVFSHVMHYLSVLALYRLSINVFGGDTAANKTLCVISAALHIITPAGAFLSAPCTEATYSFLSFAGFHLYSAALLDGARGRHILKCAKLLTASVFFAIGTTVRSNGILSGFLFAYDALQELLSLFATGLSISWLARFSTIVLGGSIVALGMLVPQYLAYASYCTSQGTRPWCLQTVPSIYGWVQSQYWNTGFLRYWTISNIPLFLLASPMLILLCQSALWVLSQPSLGKQPQSENGTSPSILSTPMLTRLAVPQMLLTALALTSYHVQIINRISSAYPVWYWFLAVQIAGKGAAPRPPSTRPRVLAFAVQAMAIYALVQAVLFGSFLPPA